MLAQMDYEDLLQYAFIALAVVTGTLSLLNGFANGVSHTNCLVPVFLQLGLLGLMFVPLLHGFPTEWFWLLKLVAVWTLCAVIFSWRLYRSPVRVSKLLGVAQFSEGVTMLFSTVAGYVGSCYTYYGHLVWAP